MIWDDAVPGLGIRVSEGSVSWFVDFRIGLKRRRVAIGPVAIVKLEEARNRAADVLNGARKGIDLTETERQRTATRTSDGAGRS